MSPYFTNTHFTGIKVGEVFTLTWASAPGSVMIKLKEGTPSTLRTVSIIADGVEGSSLQWIPALYRKYALEISDPKTSRPKYSPFFRVAAPVSLAKLIGHNISSFKLLRGSQDLTVTNEGDPGSPEFQASRPSRSSIAIRSLTRPF
ncbi:hypothetical protein V8F33_012388 [Rhypophila sp. PSN 637]